MAEEKKKTREKDIPKKKLKIVEELVNLINTSRSIIIVSIKNLPAKQFQLIKKKLSKDVAIKVLKKNIINRAIDRIERGTIKNFKKHLEKDTALIFSKLEPFELSAILSKNKSYARAKIGQKVEEDIVIEPGPTELVPGPIISELGSLGIQFSIEDGKINIKAKKVILKAGQEVNVASASIMSKLDMKPIPVGLEPVLAYDSEKDKIFENIKIDSEKTLEELKISASKALGLAVKIVYACRETVGYLLAKANAEEKILSGKIRYRKEGRETTGKEIKQEEKSIDTQQNSREEK